MNLSHLLAALAAALLAAAVAAQPPAAPAGFLTRQGSRLFLDGREYRAIGANIPHLHQAYLGTWFHIREKYGTPAQAKAAVVAALEDAERSNLRFIRFF